MHDVAYKGDAKRGTTRDTRVMRNWNDMTYTAKGSVPLSHTLQDITDLVLACDVNDLALTRMVRDELKGRGSTQGRRAETMTHEKAHS
jgi:hypothetical protein